MEQPKRIEIFGGIASGKTTLARLLCEDDSCSLVLENFRENPFWRRFYARPDLFVFEKNVCFLAQHSGEIKAMGGSPLVICDYAVFQDLAYAALTCDAEHIERMQALYDHLYRKLPRPSLFVHVQCDEKIQLERILARGREEEKSITKDYLTALNRSIETAISAHVGSEQLQKVRSDQIDFANDAGQRLALKRDLLRGTGASSEPAFAAVGPS